MKFTKMHGIGNDYVYVSGFEQPVVDPANLARRVADRHFGVGGDGLILILPSETADVRMRMFNADGSESEMCGNGVRCVAKYAYDHGLAKNNPMKIQTGRGVLTLHLEIDRGKVRQVMVNMGEPILELAKIPVDAEKLQPSVFERMHQLVFGDAMEKGSSKARPMSQTEPPVDAVFVSMGNPHAVIFVPEVQSVNLSYLGPLVENHIAFPRRINAHWVQVVGQNEVIMRTWERGSGITLACGTGASAVCVSGALTNRHGRKILAHLPGGDLELRWGDDNHVYMTGPAEEVFQGEMLNAE